MKLLILFLAFLSTLSFAGERVIINPESNQDLKIKANVGGVVTDAVVIKGSSGSVTIKGETDGTAACAGCVGEYGEQQCTSSTATTSPDTYVDAFGMTVTLQPGVYRIGYHAAVSIENQSAGVLNVSGSIRLTDSSNVLVGSTEAYISAAPMPAGTAIFHSVSREAVVNITTVTTYKVRIRSSLTAGTGGRTLIHATSITGSFTNPDNHSVIFWQRIK